MARFSHAFGSAFAVVLLACPCAGWAMPFVDFAGTLAESDNYMFDANKLPISGTTDFNRGQWDRVDPLNTAEHELMHVIGFTLQSMRFRDAVNASNEIKVGGTVYGITDGTSHLDPTKMVTIGGTTYDQSKDIMQPTKVPGERIGPQDQMILNAIYNYSGIDGLLITVNFTGPAFNATDRQAINDAVAAVEFLFPAGRNPHRITWDAQNAVCGDPSSDENPGICNVPEPDTVALFMPGLAIVALVYRGRRRSDRRRPA